MKPTKDDEHRARQLSDKDLSDPSNMLSKQGSPMVLWEDVDSASMKNEFGNGERTLMGFTIGMRGYFSRHEVKRGASAWRKACAQYPQALFHPCLLGYENDPREIWEFEDARRYVRQWARFAGMDDAEIAMRYCGEVPGAMGFLAACGVFGEETRRQSLAGTTPTPRQ